MTEASPHGPICRQRAFDADVVQHCVRWYVTYRLSYRDLVEMMAGRGIKGVSSTTLRWVTRHMPESQKCWQRFAGTVGTCWRVDETHAEMKAKWPYLYDALDQHSRAVDVLPRRDRGVAATQAFFRKALASAFPREPRKMTLDDQVRSRRALWRLRREHPCWRNVAVRTNTYLNNPVEQDHRRSSDDARRRPGSSRSRMRSYRSPASSSATGFASDNPTSGRGRRCRGWSRKGD
jgi:transposase-like protein